MNIKSFPNNADEFVGAEPLMKWFHGRTSGVWSADGNAAVRPAPVASMKVEVEDGSGWLSNDKGDGITWWNETKKTTGANLSLSIDGADPALDRIDRVVVSWPTINYADPPTISILKGTPASAPVPAEMTNSTTVRMISLAQIKVPAGALKITAAEITDERLDPTVCGLVSQDMTADTSMIYSQFMDLLKILSTSIEQVASGQLSDNSVTPQKLSRSTIDLFHPVGSWWWSDDPTSPAKLFGGSWERMYDHRALIAADDGDGPYSVGKIGGEEAVALKEENNGPHVHFMGATPYSDGIYIPRWSAINVESSQSTPGKYYGVNTLSSGKGTPHNNMSPFYATYIWRRTA